MTTIPANAELLERLVYWRKRMPANWYGNRDLDDAITALRATQPAEAPAGVREALKEAISQLIPFGEDGDQPAITAAIENGRKALSAPPAREVSDDRAMKLALDICSGKLSAVQGAVEIMHYATDAIEQEKQFSDNAVSCGRRNGSCQCTSTAECFHERKEN